MGGPADGRHSSDEGAASAARLRSFRVGHLKSRSQLAPPWAHARRALAQDGVKFILAEKGALGVPRPSEICLAPGPARTRTLAPLLAIITSGPGLFEGAAHPGTGLKIASSGRGAHGLVNFAPPGSPRSQGLGLLLLWWHPEPHSRTTALGIDEFHSLSKRRKNRNGAPAENLLLRRGCPQPHSPTAPLDIDEFHPGLFERPPPDHWRG